MFLTNHNILVYAFENITQIALDSEMTNWQLCNTKLESEEGFLIRSVLMKTGNTKPYFFFK